MYVRSFLMKILLLFLLILPSIKGFGINLMKVLDDDRSQVVCSMALLRKYFNSGEPLSGSVLYMSLTTASIDLQKRLLEAMNDMEDFPWSTVIRDLKAYNTTARSSAVLHEKPQCYFLVIENLEDEDLEDIFEDWKRTLNWNPLAQFVVYLASVEETDEEMTELMIEILLSFMNKKIYNVNVIGQNEENGYYYGKTVFPYHPDNNCGNRVISIETLDVCEYQDEEKGSKDDEDEEDGDNWQDDEDGGEGEVEYEDENGEKGENEDKSTSKNEDENVGEEKGGNDDGSKGEVEDEDENRNENGEKGENEDKNTSKNEDEDEDVGEKKVNSDDGSKQEVEDEDENENGEKGENEDKSTSKNEDEDVGEEKGENDDGSKEEVENEDGNKNENREKGENEDKSTSKNEDEDVGEEKGGNDDGSKGEVEDEDENKNENEGKDENDDKSLSKNEDADVGEEKSDNDDGNKEEVEGEGEDKSIDRGEGEAEGEGEGEEKGDDDGNKEEVEDKGENGENGENEDKNTSKNEDEDVGEEKGEHDDGSKEEVEVEGEGEDKSIDKGEGEAEREEKDENDDKSKEEVEGEDKSINRGGSEAEGEEKDEVDDGKKENDEVEGDDKNIDRNKDEVEDGSEGEGQGEPKSEENGGSKEKGEGEDKSVYKGEGESAGEEKGENDDKCKEKGEDKSSNRGKSVGESEGEGGEKEEDDYRSKQNCGNKSIDIGKNGDEGEGISEEKSEDDYENEEKAEVGGENKSIDKDKVKVEGIYKNRGIGGDRSEGEGMGKDEEKREYIDEIKEKGEVEGGDKSIAKGEDGGEDGGEVKGENKNVAEEKGEDGVEENDENEDEERKSEEDVYKIESKDEIEDENNNYLENNASQGKDELEENEYKHEYKYGIENVDNIKEKFESFARQKIAEVAVKRSRQSAVKNHHKIKNFVQEIANGNNLNKYKHKTKFSKYKSNNKTTHRSTLITSKVHKRYKRLTIESNYDDFKNKDSDSGSQFFVEEIYRALFLDKFPKDLSGCPLVAAYRPWEPYIFRDQTEIEINEEDEEEQEEPNNNGNVNDTVDESVEKAENTEDEEDEEYIEDSFVDTSYGAGSSESKTPTENDLKTKLSGIEYELLKTIGERLHISIDLQVENRNLYHLFQQLIDGDIEMVIGGIDEDPSISRFVSTTIPYHQDDLTWCVAKAKRSYGLFNFLASFSSLVWMLTFLFLLIASLSITFMKKLLKLRLRHLNNYFSILFCMFGIIVNQSTQLVKMPTPIRAVFIAAFFMGLMFMNTYQSFLISTLTTPKSAYQISRMEEIYDHRMKIMGSVENVRHLSKPGKIFKYIREKFQMCYNIEECLQRAAENERLAVAVSRQHSFYNPRIPRNKLYCFNRNENLYVYLVTMLLPKKFHLLHKINPVIQYVIESGHMQKWARDLDMRRQIVEERNRIIEDAFRSLNLRQIIGSFVFTGALLTFASLVLILECWVHRLATRRRRRTRLKIVKLLHRKFQQA